MKTLNNKSGIRHISLAALICLAACTGSMPKQMYTDNPTSGEIAISVDESFKPFIESEVYVFQQLYPDAKINVRYTSEQQAMNDMLFDTTRLAIIGRDLNDFEKYVFDTMRITPAKTKIAKDALCFIANHENQDTSLYTAQLKQIFRGEATNWKQINKKSTLGNIRVVFDQNQSSNVQMLYRLFAKDNKFPDYCYAAKSNEEVIKFVKSNKNALGVIGAGWISDVDDTTHLRFRSEIRVLSISDDSLGFYKPYQGYIASTDYPLIREVYIISKEARSGLGTGLAAFIAGDKGQRIILKQGLVPATMPVRLIQTREE